MLSSLIYIPLIFYILYFILQKTKFVSKLNDKDYNKPQSFHDLPTPRLGGVLIILTIFISIFFTNIKFSSNQIISFLILNFFLGFIDDLKIIVNPFKRFLIFLIFNLILIIIFKLKIIDFDNNILNFINNYSDYTAYLLVLFCLFFCINGSNLIDGFNGLLTVHAIIVLSVLVLNFDLNQISELKIFIIIFIISLICFLILNFPYAKIFLGDGGSFIIGSMIAISIISVSNEYGEISPYFFASIIYYIFFEIFFSVFRKLFQNKNPFKPDKEHLHMLLFNYIYKKTNNFKQSNYLTSIVINAFYFITIVPLLFFKNTSKVVEIYFFVLLLFYLTNYFLLKKLNDKKN